MMSGKVSKPKIETSLVQKISFELVFKLVDVLKSRFLNIS